MPQGLAIDGNDLRSNIAESSTHPIKKAILVSGGVKL
jgi:hypothetical protein